MCFSIWNAKCFINFQFLFDWFQQLPVLFDWFQQLPVLFDWFQHYPVFWPGSAFYLSFSSGPFYKKCTCYTCNTSSAFSLYLCDLFVQFCSLLTKLYDILRGNSHWPYSLTKYFTFTIVWTSTCLVSFPGPISFASSVSWLLWTEPTGWILHQLCKGFIRLVACIGSGDPVRVLHLYTTITLDEVCSIYCWDICTTCRYQSMCYSTGASGLTALSVCSRLCLVANCSTKNWARLLTRMAPVLYCTMPFIATCVDAIGTVFWDRPNRPNCVNSV